GAARRGGPVGVDLGALVPDHVVGATDARIGHVDGQAQTGFGEVVAVGSAHALRLLPAVGLQRVLPGFEAHGVGFDIADVVVGGDVGREDEVQIAVDLMELRRPDLPAVAGQSAAEDLVVLGGADAFDGLRLAQVQIVLPVLVGGDVQPAAFARVRIGIPVQVRVRPSADQGGVG